MCLMGHVSSFGICFAIGGVAARLHRLEKEMATEGLAKEGPDSPATKEVCHADSPRNKHSFT